MLLVLFVHRRHAERRSAGAALEPQGGARAHPRAHARRPRHGRRNRNRLARGGDAHARAAPLHEHPRRHRRPPRGLPRVLRRAPPLHHRPPARRHLHRERRLRPPPARRRRLRLRHHRRALGRALDRGRHAQLVLVGARRLFRGATRGPRRALSAARGALRLWQRRRPRRPRIVAESRPRIKEAKHLPLLPFPNCLPPLQTPKHFHTHTHHVLDS
mmetsp:Transcript_25610/g.84309  ORF Transcript_25610/g.84309 Transcript_25610/m.84309 type:complete len:215 (+) Transcript_25610:945-1589(+)